MVETKAKTELLGMDALGHAAGFLRTITHPHRLRMIYYSIAEDGLQSTMNCIENRFGE